MITTRMFDAPLMGWRNPFSELERISQEMNRLSNAFSDRFAPFSMSARVFPAVNITEDHNKYYVYAELPGIKAKELDIQVHGRNLSISGERKIIAEGENTKYHRREREAGSFSRVIGLPGEIDADYVDAKMDNGILTISVAKSEASKPKQITVN